MEIVFYIIVISNFALFLTWDKTKLFIFLLEISGSVKSGSEKFESEKFVSVIFVCGIFVCVIFTCVIFVSTIWIYVKRTFICLDEALSGDVSASNNTELTGIVEEFCGCDSSPLRG